MAIVGATFLGFIGGKISQPQYTMADKIPQNIHANCIRLEDIDSWHYNYYDYVSFDLCDTNYQLGDKNLASYLEMMEKIPHDEFLDWTESDTDFWYIANKDGRKNVK